MSIDDTTIEQVSQVTDIVQIIGSYIPLKKAGANFKAPCPFHQEKTPSFMVSTQKQIFHCFGCGVGGNVFSFIMRYENISFPEAVRFLADKAGIVIPERKGDSPKRDSEKRRVADVFAAAYEYYRSCYDDKVRGSGARAYIENRGVSAEMIAQFGIGYAPNEWRGLLGFLRAKGFDDELIAKTGLIVKSPNKEAFDFFRDRVLFPIMNVRDAVVAFGGRSMGSQEPKYINTPETEHFRKRYELYGLNFARREVHKDGGSAKGTEKGTILVVEGYLDVIRLFQVGIKNAVAPLGTALTQDHVRILHRYADKAIVVFDGDEAGLKAALRSIEVFLEEDFYVDVVVLPQGCDPDSLVKERGREAFLSELERALDVFDFKLGYLLQHFSKTDSYGLMKITEGMFDILRLVKNSVLQDRYLKKLAGTIGVQESALRDEFYKGADNVPFAEAKKNVGEKKVSLRMHREEVNLLQLLFARPLSGSQVCTMLAPDDFERNDVREIYVAMLQLFRERVTRIDIAQLMNSVQTEEAKNLLSELPFHVFEEDNVDEAMSTRICEIQLKKYEKKKIALHAHICREQDEQKRNEYFQQKIYIQNEINKLKTKGLAVFHGNK